MFPGGGDLPGGAGLAAVGRRHRGRDVRGVGRLSPPSAAPAYGRGGSVGRLGVGGSVGVATGSVGVATGRGGGGTGSVGVGTGSGGVGARSVRVRTRPGSVGARPRDRGTPWREGGRLGWVPAA